MNKKTSQRLSVKAAADMLSGADCIELLTHRYPDGDTLGSAFALFHALSAMGKQVKVTCPDPIPEKYAYLYFGKKMPNFTPKFRCAVDVAAPDLMGETYSGEAFNLCIDHHAGHTPFAEYILLDGKKSAAAMLVYAVIRRMNAAITREIAACLYTGITTDTGCFKYPNTTAECHRAAAQLIDTGIDFAAINRDMFDTKTRARIALEKETLNGIQFAAGGRCAILVITMDMIRRSGADEGDLEGFAPLSRQIEGVLLGLTVRETTEGSYKISARTHEEPSAAGFCRRFGGGGHRNAAGCSMSGTLQDTLFALIRAAEDALC